MTPEYQPPLSPPPPKPKSRAMPWILGGCAVLLLGAIVLGVAGFAFYRWRNARMRSENARGESPSVSAERSQQGNTSASPPHANSANQPPLPNAASTPTTWEATAASLTGDVGTTFTMTCSPGGTMHSVWGSDVYTADSSICTAAVHSGLITYERGGTVTIELRPGRPLYGSSERNGVTTSAFGEYRRSFVFKSGTNGSAPPEAEDATPILWNTSASILTYEAGKSYKFKCPAGGTITGYVWGTDVYSADSSICAAAVHVGAISLASGGTVTIELRPGQSSYQGTTRNGVKSIDYGAYPHSFVVK
jgi:LCCL domain